MIYGELLSYTVKDLFSYYYQYGFTIYADGVTIKKALSKGATFDAVYVPVNVPKSSLSQILRILTVSVLILGMIEIFNVKSTVRLPLLFNIMMAH